MKVKILNPHGYCNGVKRAIRIVNDAINSKETKKPIYLLGNLIHNKYFSNKLNELGVITISDKNKTRFDMLDEIESGTVIFSAHGVSDSVKNKALNKGLNIIDATCGKVLIIHKNIEKYINKGYKILYIGYKKHPECEAVLDKENVILIQSENDLKNLNKNSKYYVTNQTTLSSIEIGSLYKKIRNEFPNAIIDNNICKATLERQNAIINQKNNDLCIVVGDTLSSNSKRLKEISENYAHIDSILVEKKEDIDISKLKKYKSIAITSGASTPEELFDSIIKKIDNAK